MKAIVFDFLKGLQKNNSREWFNENKNSYEEAKKEADETFNAIYNGLIALDEFKDLKIYRIYRDVRFSKDKSPYKDHFGAIFSRKQPYNRGSFYVQIGSGSSFVGGGFWKPEKDDLNRIRKAIEMEDELEKIFSDLSAQSSFEIYEGETLKTIPKGFDKEHPRADLLKKKQFLLSKNYADKQVLKSDFVQNVAKDYQTMLPFFRYMTEVLTTNENGESIV